MARGGVYRSDVERARKELLQKGKNPSVDAIRAVLGTGSNTTILRHLQEITAEAEATPRTGVPISDALAELVQRLAQQLQSEADVRLAEGQAVSAAIVAEERANAARSKQDADTFSSQLQRTQLALQEAQDAHAATCDALTEAKALIRQLEERIAGLDARLAENTVHIVSIEEKHRHAREALDHFRTSAKEQREQEQRRHEHQVHELQVALRQANDTVTGKNQELLHLNREGVRLTEQVSQLEKELRTARAELREREHERDALKPQASACADAEVRLAQSLAANDSMALELMKLGERIATEAQARQIAEASAAHAAGRIEAMENVIARLGPLNPAVDAPMPASAVART